MKRGNILTSILNTKSSIFVGLLISAAVAPCIQTESSSPFGTIFEKLGQISIQTQGLEVGQIQKINVDHEGNLLLLDVKSVQLLAFNKTGQLAKSIGKRGQGPGEFNSLFGLHVDGNGNIYVSDLQARRINIFDKAGNYVSSFIHSAHWPPHLIKTDSVGNLFLGGLKEEPDGTAPGTWIHKYTREGKYLTSFYPRKDGRDWLRNIYPFFGFDIDKEDMIYAVQMHEYDISVYDSSGNFIRSIGKSPPHFKRPDPKMRVDWTKFTTQSEMAEALTKISRSWTRIIQLDIVKDRYMFLLIEVNNLIKGFEKKYALDILDKTGHPVARGIQTDYKFLTSDNNGRAYFLEHTDEETALDRAPSYLIGIYNIRLD